MSEAGVTSPAGGPPPRRARVRKLVANRSGRQRVGAAAAVLLLLTAPFGGLRSAEDSDVQPLVLGQKIDIGPFYVTVQKVVTLSDLAPAAVPQPGNRLLVIEVLVTNHTDRAEYANLVTAAFTGKGTGAVPWPDEEGPELHVFDVDDGAHLGRGEFVNPDQTYQWALVLEQAPGWDPDRLRLTVSGFPFIEDDPQALDSQRWDDAHPTPLVEGHVETEVKE